MTDYRIDPTADNNGNLATEHNGTPYDVRYQCFEYTQSDLSAASITIVAVINCNTMAHLDPTSPTARTIIKDAMPSIISEQKEILDKVDDLCEDLFSSGD